MPSQDVFEELKQLGLDIDSGDNKRFNTLDTLASNNDLEVLFHTLRKFKDKNNNHPKITALSLCANPDFEKIVKEEYKQYFFEPFTTTLEKYGHHGTFQIWRQGENEKLFYPEFHGREHLNIKIWMEALQQSDYQTVEGFKRGFWGFRPKNNWNISYQAAFDLDKESSLEIQKDIVSSGLRLFEKLYGRKARFFVPPNGAINQEIINCSAHHGIRFVSSPKIYKEPLGYRKTKRRFRFLGQRGIGNIRYLTRNCFFEPSYPGKGFSTADCINQIDTAFKFRKPAIISTHRVNYIGGLNKENRKSGNEALELLLGNIIKNWPEVEFMTSKELGMLIAQNDS